MQIRRCIFAYICVMICVYMYVCTSAVDYVHSSFHLFSNAPNDWLIRSVKKPSLISWISKEWMDELQQPSSSAPQRTDWLLAYKYWLSFSLAKKLNFPPRWRISSKSLSNVIPVFLLLYFLLVSLCHFDRSSLNWNRSPEFRRPIWSILNNFGLKLKHYWFLYDRVCYIVFGA